MNREKATVGYQTYKKYAKKYGIILTNEKRTCYGTRKLKTMKELSQEIFHYEKVMGVKDGLYF